MNEDASDPLSWVRDRSPLLGSYADRFADEQPFADRFVAVSAPITPHTGLFVETLVAGGATVGVTGEPGSTHADVVRHLDARPNVTTYATPGMSDAEIRAAQRDLLQREPDLIADDGCYLLSLVHDEFPDIAAEVLGGCEQTTGGMTRLRAMAEQDVLAFPVYGVNDTPMKNHFDNVHGTAESTITELASITNTMIAGTTAVVAGYGHCGRGLARKLRDLGARTIVTEVDPRRALEAIADGHEVTEMDEAARRAELLLTATGQFGIVERRHFERLPDGAVVATAGSSIEIEADALADMAERVSDPRPGIDRYHLSDGRCVNLLTEGNVVNLAGPDADGNPVEVMDTTFAMMTVALAELADPDTDLAPGVHDVPDRLDRRVAEEKLATMGVSIDEVSTAQREYAHEWERHASIDPGE